MSDRKISFSGEATHPLPLQIPERRRTVSLGGLRHFYESIGNSGGSNGGQYPTFGMLRDMNGSSPRTPQSASSSMPNQSTDYLSGHSPVSDTLPSPTGVGLSGLLRRASWIEGSAPHAGSLLSYGANGGSGSAMGNTGSVLSSSTGNSGQQHLFNSLPNRMRRPGVLRQSSDVPSTRAPITAITTTNKAEATAGPPDTIAGHPFMKTRSESAIDVAHSNNNGQQAHPRLSALAAPTAHKAATAAGSGPKRPATPMSNMILSGQMLD
ncbi:hypothetical protein BDF19DRAFT_435143 [Syncephalis fuscata]|nr:hypothetical protein BDF19DRAFT_435143 [Syncephalis fuscata]